MRETTQVAVQEVEAASSTIQTQRCRRPQSQSQSASAAAAAMVEVAYSMVWLLLVESSVVRGQADQVDMALAGLESYRALQTQVAHTMGPAA